MLCNFTVKENKDYCFCHCCCCCCEQQHIYVQLTNKIGCAFKENKKLRKTYRQIATEISMKLRTT